MTINRGHIYFADLDPTVENAINKRRPVLVVSNNINNQFSNIIMVIPITSNTSKVMAFEVFLPAGEGNFPQGFKGQMPPNTHH
jgi:mRNA interferase MazF